MIGIYSTLHAYSAFLRSMRLSLLLLLVATGARAQEATTADFFPFDSGNEWEYVVANDGNPNAVTVLGYVSVRAHRDTLVDGLPGAVYSVVRRNADGQVATSTICTGYLDGSSWYASPGSDCALGEDQLRGGRHWIPGAQAGGPVSISGDIYEAPALSKFSIPLGIGPGGSGASYAWGHAAGLGLHYWQEIYQRRLPPAYSSRRTGRLVYAKIGGKTFGASVVSSAPVLEITSDGLKIASFPNPFQSSVNLSTNSLAGPVDLVLYDMLGRTVWETVASSSVTIDLSRLPSGIYLLRAEDQVGRVSTRRLIRAE